MNIRELAAKADFNVAEFGIFFISTDANVEATLKRFAEQVVKQCADHIRDVGYDDIADDLLKRFEE